MRRINL